MRTCIVAFFITALALAAAGCAPTPLAPPRGAAPKSEPLRPMKGGDTSGNLEIVRQQLVGVWDLASLETVPPGGGARIPIAASGTLVYDEYANLTIDAHTTDPNAPPAARESTLLRFKGRAVIDAVNKELKLMALTGNVDPSEVLAPDQRRRYEITMDTLKLSSIDAAGDVTAIALWQRRK